ncbi:MAG: DUF4278 domain-containing protein [Leptolyngbyaceae cyanobacterium]
MKLTYRGINYDLPSSEAIATSSESTTTLNKLLGKYRGAVLTIQAYPSDAIAEAPIHGKYRGIDYPINCLFGLPSGSIG